MKINIKVILLGGIAFYVTQFIVSMGTGPVVHDNILMSAYAANAQFWAPELRQEPPDMAALMPRLVAIGLIAAFILTAIYDNIRAALSGSGFARGAKFGFIAFLFHACYTAGWSSFFDLPDRIWIWWNVENLVVMVIAGLVLGFVVSKLAAD